MQRYSEIPEWKDILDRLSAIREQDNFSTGNVDFIRSQLQSPDDRVRAGAALTAEGCIFEPNVLDILIDQVESEGNNAVRKASIQSLGQMIYEGVMQEFEDTAGADTDMEYYEEWEELQSETLKDDYLRVKHLLYSILQDVSEDSGVREASLNSLSDLGFLETVREWIAEFAESEHQSAQLVAVHAMGKFPQYWEEQISRFLTPQTPRPLMLEAISSSYSSGSKKLAKRIEPLLDMQDPDILSYALLTLANINQTENLGQILQQFNVHENEKVREAAKEAVENYSRKNFKDYFEKKIGFEE